MDREIKFRAWQKWHEYMFTPDYIDFINGNIIIGEHDGDSRYEDIPLMQYTGLKDKNGKEIYEGDIVVEENSKRYVVKWEEDTSCSSNSSSCGFCWSKEEAKHIEVIGNIYENPEFTQSSE